MTIINEPGLYSAILKSRKLEVKAFKRWMTHEVIPAIRKTGSYSIMDGYAIDDPINLVLTQQVHELKLKASYYALICKINLSQKSS